MNQDRENVVGGHRSSIRTNRDLYRFVAALDARHREGARSLESYLRALRGVAQSIEHKGSGLALSRFAEMLESALTCDVPPFEEDWTKRSPSEVGGTAGYEQWEDTIVSQIVDLNQMDQAGTLSDELRYLGVDAPRGSRWYNFDVFTYLECGVQGAFRGWDSGDGTKPMEIEMVTWELFTNFIRAGQSYE